MGGVNHPGGTSLPALTRHLTLSTQLQTRAVNPLSEVAIGFSLHRSSSLALPVGAEFATEGLQGHVPLLVGLCRLLNGSVHPSPLLIQLLMEL